MGSYWVGIEKLPIWLSNRAWMKKMKTFEKRETVRAVRASCQVARYSPFIQDRQKGWKHLNMFADSPTNLFFPSRFWCVKNLLLLQRLISFYFILCFLPFFLFPWFSLFFLFYFVFLSVYIFLLFLSISFLLFFFFLPSLCVCFYFHLSTTLFFSFCFLSSCFCSYVCLFSFILFLFFISFFLFFCSLTSLFISV